MNKGTVLIVEDEPISRKVIADTLRQAGYHIESCEDGAQAYKFLLAGKRADVIILDRMMPVMDGMALLEKLSRDPLLKKIPVIMLTSVSDNNAIVEALEAGAHEYLTKPVNPEALLAMVKQIIATKNNEGL